MTKQRFEANRPAADDIAAAITMIEAGDWLAQPTADCWLCVACVGGTRIGSGFDPDRRKAIALAWLSVCAPNALSEAHVPLEVKPFEVPADVRFATLAPENSGAAPSPCGRKNCCVTHIDEPYVPTSDEIEYALADLYVCDWVDPPVLSRAARRAERCALRRLNPGRRLRFVTPVQARAALVAWLRRYAPNELREWEADQRPRH